MSPSIVVIKVGGSLLDWPELPERLTAYLKTRRHDRRVLVVGGGRFADVLRDFDETHQIGEIRSHALALRVLDFTAHLLETLVEGTKVFDEPAELETGWAANLIPILTPRLFLERDDRSPDPLPHAWTTTTDSIAARLAVRFGASELVLLKSVEVPTGCNPFEASKQGLVDPEFPRAAIGVPVVSFMNLRAGNTTTYSSSDSWRCSG